MKKKTFNTKTVVFGAFLVTIAFLLGGGFARFTGIPTSIKINFGGAQQSIGFTAVPLVIASIVLGVGSPCEWRGGARHCSRAMVGECGLETC